MVSVKVVVVADVIDIVIRIVKNVNVLSILADEPQLRNCNWRIGIADFASISFLAFLAKDEAVAAAIDATDAASLANHAAVIN